MAVYEGLGILTGNYTNTGRTPTKSGCSVVMTHLRSPWEIVVHLKFVPVCPVLLLTSLSNPKAVCYHFSVINFPPLGQTYTGEQSFALKLN